MTENEQFVLCVYDIPQRLKIANPSPRLRRYGTRINLSAWVFPASRVPVDDLEDIRTAGGDVHLIRFAREDHEKILAMATAEIKRQCRAVMESVEKSAVEIQTELDARLAVYGSDSEPVQASVKAWRAVANRARREAIKAQECAVGFGLLMDVQEGVRMLTNFAAAQIGAALAWRMANCTAEKVGAA